MSAEEIEAKDKRNKKIIVIVLGLIMLLSSLSYAFLSFEQDDSGTGTTGEKVSFNGLDFSETDYGTWTFSISEYNFETKYNPEETLNISVVLTKNLQAYSNLALYFGADNLEDIETAGNSEIIQNIGGFLLKYQTSCLTINCTENLPIKNCSTDNVIIFQKAEKTAINENEKCIYIKYTSGDELRAADAFIFKILGVR